MRTLPEWQQLLSTKSTTRYLPPKGTALTARSAVRTPRRSPPPPDSTSVIVLRTAPPSSATARSEVAAEIEADPSMSESRRLGTASREVKERQRKRGDDGAVEARSWAYQLHPTETSCVGSNEVSSGNWGSSAAKKRWSETA